MDFKLRSSSWFWTKDRSLSSVRDRIYDDPAYTDDISHLANPMRRSSFASTNLINEATSGVGGGSSSLGKRSKLTKEFLKIAQEDLGRLVFSSSDDDLQPVAAVRSSDRGRSLERGRMKKESTKEHKSSRSEKLTTKRNLSLDNKLHDSQHSENVDELISENPAPSSLTRHNLSKQRTDDSCNGSRQRPQESLPDQDDLFSTRSSKGKDSATTAERDTSTAASVSSVNTSSTTKMQMGRRFLKGEIGIKSFNYYLLKEGLKSSKKFVEKQRNNLQMNATNGGANNLNITTVSTSPTNVVTSSISTLNNKNKLQTRSEENIYEEIFFKDAPLSDDDENQNLPNSQQTINPNLLQTPSDTVSHSGNLINDSIVYADCELCMQQCNRQECDYCYRAERANNAGNSSSQLQFQQQTFNLSSLKANQVGNNYQSQTSMIINNSSAIRSTANETHVTTAPILEFQSYNPNNPGVYKIETTPVAITGDYNPILQFQQQPSSNISAQHYQNQYSTSNNSTATTTPSENQQQHRQKHHQHHLQQQQQFYTINHQQQQNTYGTPVNTTFWSQNGQVRQRNNHQTSSYNLNNLSSVGGHLSMQRMNTKSSSSSDSLQYYHQQQQQQQQKFNTLTQLDVNHYAASRGEVSTASTPYLYTQPMYPLMYAASGRLGGSQILLDTNSSAAYDAPTGIYKTDSRASILSEYSLSRSSDTYYASQRYGGAGLTRHFPHTQMTNTHFGDSLLSSYATSAQRRYFGSAESCRFAFDCRRCSFENVPVSTNTSTVRNGKCPYSENCHFDCRNCDCSSNYFSSDFDELYSGGGIPRKTAKGTLPSTGGQPPPALDDYEENAANERKQSLKQNKYAQDFFKHVSDVKRSIYQAEMQRAGVMEPGNSKKLCGKEKNESEKEECGSMTTLPLIKERSRKPTPAPRNSLHQNQTTAGQLTPHPLTRRLHQQKNEAIEENKPEYSSLDRLVIKHTGTIPKMSVNDQKQSPQHASQTYGKSNERFQHSVDPVDSKLHGSSVASLSNKRHGSSLKTSTSLNAALPLKRRDIPAPPPPSPATYADLQELRYSLKQQQQRCQITPNSNNTSEDADRKLKIRKYGASDADQESEQALHNEKNIKEKDIITENLVACSTSPLRPLSTTEQLHTLHTTITMTPTEDYLTITEASVSLPTESANKSSFDVVSCGTTSTDMATAATSVSRDMQVIVSEQQANDDESTFNVDIITSNSIVIPIQSEAAVNNAIQAATVSSLPFASISASSATATTFDSQQRDQNDDDDVFYDARSEDSNCTAASYSAASNKQQSHHFLIDLEAKRQTQPHPTPLLAHQQEMKQQNLEAKEMLEERQKQEQQSNENCSIQNKINEQKKEKTMQNHVENINNLNDNNNKHNDNDNKENATACSDVDNNHDQSDNNDVDDNGENGAGEVISTEKDNAINAIVTTATAILTSTTTTITTQLVKVNSISEYEKTRKQTKCIGKESSNAIVKHITSRGGKDRNAEKPEKRSKHNRKEPEKEVKTKLTMNLDDEKTKTHTSTTTIRETSTTTATATTASTSKYTTAAVTMKKQRTQRRSPNSCQGKSLAPTLSCDTCCQEEYKPELLLQQHLQQHEKDHTQHSSTQTLKPPTLHIGKAGQPTRLCARRKANSKERASKTKHEIKTKIIYSSEKPESIVTNNNRETGFITKTTTATASLSEACAKNIKSTNVADTKERTHKRKERKSEKSKTNENRLVADNVEVEKTENEIKKDAKHIENVEQHAEDVVSGVIVDAIIKLQHETEQGNDKSPSTTTESLTLAAINANVSLPSLPTDVEQTNSITTADTIETNSTAFSNSTTFSVTAHSLSRYAFMLL
ncbi:hypothetical protein GQX74_015196 [Glossina fuscipes]|nr:hypothetical protein GQX74_015196 [Glossina fuscipes]